MSYVKEVMGDGEELVYMARFPWYQHALAWGSLLLLGVAVIGIIIFLWIMVRIWTTEIAVTTNRLIVKRGWISRSTEELSVRSIEEVNLVQGFFGRILNYGRVHVGGSGEGHIITPLIAHPTGFRKALADMRVRGQTGNGQQ